MSLVPCPCRNVLASAPVRASLPGSDRSRTNVTDERLATLVEPRQPAPHLALELVHHAVARDARVQRRAHDGSLLDAVEALQQGQQPIEVQRKIALGHVR